MLVFMVLFAIQQPFAVQSEYAVLLLFFTLSACNLFTLARVVDTQPAAPQLAPVQAHSRFAWLDRLVSVSMLTFVIGLVSMIFLIEYLSM